MSEEFYHLPLLEDVSATFSSCFHKLDIVEHISLLPCFVGRLSQGICEHLNKKLLRYSEPYRGVLLAYSKPRVQQSHGRILDEQPHIHFDLEYTAYVFRPVVGSIVCGTVNNVGEDHVGCLIYDCFNASVFSKSKREKRERHLNGLFTSKFQVGSLIWFKVVSIENVSGILSIIGEYGDPSQQDNAQIAAGENDTQLTLDSSLEDVEQNSQNQTELHVSSLTCADVIKTKLKKGKHSKRKKREEESFSDSSRQVVESEAELSCSIKKKHKKKSKHVELSSEDEEEERKRHIKKRKQSEISSESPKKKKKKLLADDDELNSSYLHKKKRKSKR